MNGFLILLMTHDSEKLHLFSLDCFFVGCAFSEVIVESVNYLDWSAAHLFRKILHCVQEFPARKSMENHAFSLFIQQLLFPLTMDKFFFQAIQYNVWSRSSFHGNWSTDKSKLIFRWYTTDEQSKTQENLGENCGRDLPTSIYNIKIFKMISISLKQLAEFHSF